MGVLLLRPEHKVWASQQRFADAGIECVGVALQTCLPRDNITDLISQVDWRDVDHIIFTSSVAARYTLPLLPQLGAHTCIYAIGNATFQTLAQWTSQHPFWCNGHQLFRAPLTGQDSEGLLTHSRLQHVACQQALIIKGEGGRHVLRDTLEARAAVASEACVYMRCELSTPIATHAWQEADIHTIIATSGEQIQLAFKHFAHHWLRQCNWVVVSQRLVAVAQSYQINKITLATSASDEDLLATLQT
jgi:uroporphyrinogen-III synthase